MTNTRDRENGSGIPGIGTKSIGGGSGGGGSGGGGGGGGRSGGGGGGSGLVVVVGNLTRPKDDGGGSYHLFQVSGLLMAFEKGLPKQMLCLEYGGDDCDC